MRPRHALMVTALLAVGIVACSERPDPFERDNPLDPVGGGPDPFGLVVSFDGISYRLTWNDLSSTIPGLTGYSVWRGDAIDGNFIRIVGLPVLAGVAPEFVDDEYTRNGFNWYQVRAEKGSEISSASLVTPAGGYAPPSVSIVGGGLRSVERVPEVELLPLPPADGAFELAFDADFTSPLSFDLDAVNAGPTVDLGARALGDTIKLYARVRDGAGDVTPAGRSDVLAASDVLMTAPQAAVAAITDTVLLLSLEGLSGVTRFRTALTAPGLDAAPWVVPVGPDTTTLVNLDADSLVQRVWGDFESEFGFVLRDRTPPIAAVDSLGLTLFSLAGGDSTMALAEIEITGITAQGASYMRFSEDISFAGVAWMPISNRTDFTLSPEPGSKVVYGQFTSPFVDDIHSAFDSILLLGSSAARPR